MDTVRFVKIVKFCFQENKLRFQSHSVHLQNSIIIAGAAKENLTLLTINISLQNNLKNNLNCVTLIAKTV